MMWRINQTYIQTSVKYRPQLRSTLTTIDQPHLSLTKRIINIELAWLHNLAVKPQMDHATITLPVFNFIATKSHNSIARSFLCHLSILSPLSLEFIPYVIIPPYIVIFVPQRNSFNISCLLSLASYCLSYAKNLCSSGFKPSDIVGNRESSR